MRLSVRDQQNSASDFFSNGIARAQIHSSSSIFETTFTEFPNTERAGALLDSRAGPTEKGSAALTRAKRGVVGGVGAQG